MRSLTYSLSYYNQGKEAIMKHINMWKEYPKEITERISFYLLDDCSKEPLNEVIKDEDFQDLDIHIYRVEVDLYCNIPGVMNLSARECKTEWIIMLDMDTLVSSGTARKFLELIDKDEKKTVYKFNRDLRNVPHMLKKNPSGFKIHPKVCMIRVKDFWDTGGYEEDLVGNYGMTDPIFFYRVKGKLDTIFCHDIFLTYYSEGESDIKRDVKKNTKLFEKRKRDGKWSTDYVRFPWKKVF